MAEASLRAVSSADESVEQTITTKEPDKVSQCILKDVDELNEKFKDAERLLFYAAEAGIDIETNVREAVLKAKINAADNWSEQTAVNLLSALTALAGKLRPVTADSLKECADGPAVRAFIRWYKRMTIGLAIFIVPFSLVTFITSAISDAIRKDIETSNALAVKLDDEAKRNASGPDVTRNLQEFAATNRAIHARASQLNFFVMNKVTDPSSKYTEEELRKKTELPADLANIPDEVKVKIAWYQDVRHFAQSIREIVSTIYGAMGTCILPMFYALLGACAFLLRSLEEKIKARSFAKSDAHTARFLIAAIAGGVVGMFNNFIVGQSAPIPPLALAFLVGYAADVFFSFIDGLLQTFTRGGAGSEVQSAAKT